MFCIPYYFQSLLEKVNNALCFLQVFCLLSPGEQQKEESAIWIYLELSPKELSSLFFSKKLSSGVQNLKTKKIAPLSSRCTGAGSPFLACACDSG